MPDVGRLDCCPALPPNRLPGVGAVANPREGQSSRSLRPREHAVPLSGKCLKGRAQSEQSPGSKPTTFDGMPKKGHRSPVKWSGPAWHGPIQIGPGERQLDRGDLLIAQDGPSRLSRNVASNHWPTTNSCAPPHSMPSYACSLSERRPPCCLTNLAALCGAVFSFPPRFGMHVIGGFASALPFI